MTLTGISRRLVVCLHFGLLLVLGLAPLDADARVETLSWGHPEPGTVEGFFLHYGTTSGVYDVAFDVGLVFSHEVTVADSDTIYIAVSAYNNTTGLLSPLSNEIVRAGGTAAGGALGAVGPTGGATPNDAGGSTGAAGGALGAVGPTGDATPNDARGSIGGGRGGADWLENFENASLGTYVLGWRDTRAKKSMIEDDSLFEVVDFNGNRVFRTNSMGDYVHSHYEGSGSAAWSNFEVRGRFRASDERSKGGITSHSSYPVEDAYYSVGIHWLTGEFQITGAPSPWITTHSGFRCHSKGTGVFVQRDTWFRLALRVDIGPTYTDLLAKAWRDGQAEPANWQAHCWDDHPDLPSRGTIGVWSGNRGVKYWDDLEVRFDPPPAQFVPEPTGSSGWIAAALVLLFLASHVRGRGRLLSSRR